MATLAPPFILCPLAESKELVGFSREKDDNSVILTLGRNIAIRYLVAEQKQETSWTCSRHWFTSKVVYCPDLEKYAATVDETAVWTWLENDTNLSSAKKYKFKQQVFEVVPTDSLGTFVVLKNGIVAPLMEAAKPENRKFIEAEGLVDTENLQLRAVVVNEEKNLIIVVAGEKTAEKKKCRYGHEKEARLLVYAWQISGSLDGCKCVGTTTVTPSQGKIVGWTTISNDEEVFFLYLDSSGDLHKKTIVKFTTGAKESPESYESEALSKKGAFKKYVSIENPVVMEPYNDTTIICYGSDSAEEGAIVFIYDIQFDLVLSRQALKLYSNPPIMGRTESFLFIPLGLNILVVGIRLGKSLLSAVAGRNKIQSVDFFESRDPWKTGWEQNISVPRKDKKVHIENLNETVYDGIDLTDLEAMAGTLEKNGYPESLICAQVIPQALEKSDSSAVKWILEYFDEIPEKYLVDLMLSLLPSKKKATSEEAMETENKDSLALDEVQAEIIRNIVSRTCDNTELVKNLKAIDYSDAKILLEVLINEYQDEPLVSSTVASIETSTAYLASLMWWLGAVLDAQYSNFVFNGEVDLVELLLKGLRDRIHLMKQIEGFGPLVEIIRNRTKYDARPDRNAVYRVESVIFT